MRLPLAMCGALALAMLTSGCDRPPEPALPESADGAPWQAEQEELAARLASDAQQRLRRLSVSATGFGDAVDGLLQDPTEARLDTARQAWSHLYRTFNEAFVVLACKASRNPADQARLLRADVFPILPGYVDGLAEWPDSGIVHDPVLPLTREALLEQQGMTQEGEASVGFQVIHFLLNGEPGIVRTVETFIGETELAEDQAGELADQPRNRRRAYLHTASALLVEDLTLLSRTEDAALTVTPICPVGALQRLVARLIRLDGLAAHTEVNQEYLAADARTTAIAGLQAAAEPWLGRDTPLAQWLAVRVPQVAVPDPLPAPQAKDRLARLQQVHATLSGALDALHPRQ